MNETKEEDRAVVFVRLNENNEMDIVTAGHPTQVGILLDKIGDWLEGWLEKRAKKEKGGEQ